VARAILENAETSYEAYLKKSSAPVWKHVGALGLCGLRETCLSDLTIFEVLVMLAGFPRWRDAHARPTLARGSCLVPTIPVGYADNHDTDFSASTFASCFGHIDYPALD
jgi:hypothetical protein